MWGLSHVVDLNDAERVRVIRNECREFMTRDQAEISVEQQRQWWGHRVPGTRLYLMTLGDHDVGYGLTHLESGKLTLSGGLGRAWRGQGLGEVLFRLLMRTPPCVWELQAGNPLYLEVLLRNEAARRVYERIGFKELDRFDAPPGRVVRMSWRQR